MSPRILSMMPVSVTGLKVEEPPSAPNSARGTVVASLPFVMPGTSGGKPVQEHRVVLAEVGVFVEFSRIFIALHSRNSEVKMLPKCNYFRRFSCDFPSVTDAQFGDQNVAKMQLFLLFYLIFS